MSAEQPVHDYLNAARTAALRGQDAPYVRAQPVASDLDPQSCLRRQVLEIVRGDLKPPLEPEVLDVLREGKDLESRAVRMLDEMGIEVMERGAPFHLTHPATGQRCVSGKIDGVIRVRAERYVLEVKKVPWWMYGKINRPEDWVDGGWWWTRKYPPQLQLYLLGRAIDRGLWLVTDGRRWKFLPVLELDFAAAGEALTFAERVVEAVNL